MFGRKKMYKKGMEDAMQAYKQFGEKQEAALEKIREEVRKGNKKLEDMISELGDDIFNVYDYLTDKEKSALYNLCTPKDIKELGDAEKRMLLAVLYQLAENEGAWGLTDYQKKYIRSVQKYLEITNPQTNIDLSVVENLDSLEDQKAIMQTVLEFLYLQENNELSDDQEEFLGCFCINKKQAEQIELYVSKLYNTVGAEGLCEKYGFVSDEIENDALSIDDKPQQDDYSCYYDFKIKAIRRWKNDEVIIEPRYNPDFKEMYQIKDKLLWENVDSDKKNIYHIVDIKTGKELVTVHGYENFIGFSEKSYCVMENEKLVVKNYDHNIIMEIPQMIRDVCPISFNIFEKFVFSRYLVVEYRTDYFKWKENKKGGLNSYVMVYDMINGSDFEIDCIDIDNEGHIEELYTIDNKLYIIINIKEQGQVTNYYDLWCYDLQKKIYLWKKYRIIQKHTGSGLGADAFIGKGVKLVERSNKVFYYFVVDYEEHAYIVLDKNTGELLKEKHFYESQHIYYAIATVVGNTFLSLQADWDQYEFCNYYQTLDIDSLQENTEEAKNIIDKMGISHSNSARFPEISSI